MTAEEIERVILPHIRTLKPYRCARDDFSGSGDILLLDANENAALSNNGLNLYPDPHQRELKRRYCDKYLNVKNEHASIRTENVFVGVGSDEAIDLLMRVTCQPQRDCIVQCPPTYGMYSVSAAINNVAVVSVPLLLKDYQLDVPALLEVLVNEQCRLVMLCNPGNPTGTALRLSDIVRVLQCREYTGLVVVDEAYIDFTRWSPDKGSAVTMLADYPRLVVLQTMSKSFGLAGARVGMAIGHPVIISAMNRIKPPYNVNTLSSRAALCLLHDVAAVDESVEELCRNRQWLVVALTLGVGRIRIQMRGGHDANFLLLQLTSDELDEDVALKVQQQLAKRGVVVRYRGDQIGCQGCLRVTVGTRDECKRLQREWTAVLRQL